MSAARICGNSGIEWRGLLLAFVGVAIIGGLAACTRQSEAQVMARVDQSIAAGEWRKAGIDLKAFLQREPENLGARLRLGRVGVEVGDYAGAARELEHAQKLGASAGDIALPYARALMALKRYQDVLDHIEPQSATDPSGRAQLLRIRGDAFFALSRPKEAIDAYDAALKVDAQNVEAGIGRAFAILQIDGLEAALAALDHANAAPDDPRMSAARGTLYLQGRDFARAEAVFTQQLQGTPEDDVSVARLGALAGLAEAQLSQNKLEAAQVTTNRLYRAVPASPVAIYLRARYLFLAGDYSESQTLLEQLLTRQPGNNQARLLLGAVNFAQGNLGQADMHLSSVLASEPGNSFARALLATARMRENKTREAIDTLGPDIQRGDAQALALAAQASMRAGDVDAGVSYLERNAAEQPADANRKLQLGAGYIAAGRYDQAVKTLEQLPADGDAGYRRSLLLINARMRDKDLKGALREAQSLARSRPDDALAQSTLGELLATNGDLDGARARFNKAAELEPRNAVAQINLAKLDMLQKRNEDAAAHLSKARELAPNNTAVLVASAQFEMARGNTKQALQWLETARQRDKAAVDPRLMLAQYQLARRDFNAAAALANEILAVAPDNSSALNILGIALASSGHTGESVNALKQAAQADPKSAAAQVNLAQAEMAAGRLPEALAAVRASLDLQPDFAPALALGAAISLRNNDERGTSDYLARLRRVDPKHPALFIVGGDIAARDGRYAEAARMYASGRAVQDNRDLALREFLARRSGKLAAPTQPLEEWLKKSPQDQRTRLVLAQAQQEAGAHKDAIANYERVAAADERDYVALNNLALLYEEVGDARAIDTARRAYELAPSTPAVADTYGWMLLQKGDLKQAAPILAKAAAAAPRVADIQYHHAAALARSGDAKAARDTLGSVLADNTQFASRESAEKLLASLNDASKQTTKE